MRSEIDQAQAAIEALEILVQVYARERTELTERLKGHLDANKDNLTQRLKEATEQHTKALGNEAQALRNFERQKDLARKGVDSKQAWELAQLKWTQALNEKNAWEAVVGRNQAEINANSQGILLDGYCGTPYAQQRMDELDMRSTEARAKLTQEQTRRDALQRELTLIQRVNWRTLKWLIAILVGTAVGILIYLLDNYKFINHPDELKAAFFWTFMSLLIVAVAALGCISPIYRRVRERFALSINVRLTCAALSAPLEGRTKDISLHGCGIRFDQPVPELSGALSLHFKDIGSTEAREVRRAEGRDVFFELVNVPEATENALFARLFLDPAHGGWQPLCGMR
ncbi:MAG TPA: PilZ domain-containing protein [Terrimicrobiaceae bacterium]|nr:PilZ domain-containing protein [Terrimicrobiaceae bacterium]